MRAWLSEMYLGNWGCSKEMVLAVLPAWLTGPSSLTDAPGGQWGIFFRCCSSSNRLPLSQWEVSLKRKAFSSVASHEDCPGQALLTWAGLREQTAGDPKGFLFPCPLSHQHLCGFIYTFCSRFFWCLFQNKTVNYLAEWPFDKHWTCTCTICINV